MEQWKPFYTRNAAIGNWKESEQHKDRTSTWWISNLGRVKVTYSWKDTVKYPKLSVTSNNHHEGYLAISINYAPEKYVHRLVARYFLEPPTDPTKVTIDHINGDKRDNRVTNLQWMSYAENIRKSQKPRTAATRLKMSESAKKRWAEKKQNNNNFI